MEDIQDVNSSNIKIQQKKSSNFIALTPKRKISAAEYSSYSPKKIRSLLKRDNQSISGQAFLNPSRFQKRKKKEKEKSKRKMASKYNIQEFEKKIREISRKLLDKYINPYMEYLYKEENFFAGFVKNIKPTYYNFYQINYVLDKKRCSLYINFKDHKLFLDNQEFLLKYFTKRETKTYLNYLLYFIYEKDPYVKSNKSYCLKKDRKHIKDDYNDIIIKNIFGAYKTIFTKNIDKIPLFYNKNDKNIDQKLFDKKYLKKQIKISIPKYYLNIKPIISDINYLFIKDLPNSKIPNIIPNYYPNNLSIFYILKDHILKNKYSIYMINYKECLFKKELSNKSNSNKSKDINNILDSYITNDSNSKNREILYDSDKSILNLSRFHKPKDTIKIHSAFRRLKNDIDIHDLEKLVNKIINTEIKKDEFESNINDIDNININYKEKEIFLSSLKKPFIGNRTQKEIFDKNIKKKKNISLDKIKEDKLDEIDEKIDITKSINAKLKYLKMRNERLNKKHPLHLYIDNKKKTNENMVLQFYNLENNKENNYKLKFENKNFLNKYFPDRFLNSKKYREYLLNSPFLKVLQNFDPSVMTLDSKIYDNKTRNNDSKKANIFIKENAFSPNKRIYLFKDTYKFLSGMKKREDWYDFKQNFYDKTNIFYRQFKTLNFATKNRSNFKKSGAFAFSSFSGSNYDKTENEWKETADIELQNTYLNSFIASNLMKKIQNDYKKRLSNLKSCTTFKDIAKCPNIYV